MIPKRAQFVLAAALACDPALTRLFTPLHPQLGAYEVCTDDRAPEVVVASEDKSMEGAAPATPELAPTAGERRRVHYSYGPIEAVEPLEAFGDVGTYDRAAVVRLYGGRRVAVARGWIRDGNRFESVTLVSPYPDASLSRLEPGTLVIRWVTRNSELRIRN